MNPYRSRNIGIELERETSDFPHLPMLPASRRTPPWWSGLLAPDPQIDAGRISPDTMSAWRRCLHRPRAIRDRYSHSRYLPPCHCPSLHRCRWAVAVCWAAGQIHAWRKCNSPNSPNSPLTKVSKWVTIIYQGRSGSREIRGRRLGCCPVG